MDAPADDRDVKLYRASSDLIPELRIKIPKLVWHQVPSKQGKVRQRVLWSKIPELVLLLDRFQEWPQLLDPYLNELLQTLVDAFLAYLIEHGHIYQAAQDGETVPLPRAICQILYTFCKVRGQKVILRFLNNEPKYIEPMLANLMLWTGQIGPHNSNSITSSKMVWEERYIMLLWLSHLMLAPFDLASISAPELAIPQNDSSQISRELPEIAKTLLVVAYEYLFVPSKEREAASALIVRLVLRGDMQAYHLHEKLVDFVVFQLTKPGLESVTPYRYVGLLSLLSGIMNTGSDTDVARFIVKTFQICSNIATLPDTASTVMRDSAPVRKLLIKTMRLSVVHALSLRGNRKSPVGTSQLEAMLEEAIQYLLDALGDKDTPVRMAASKNLAVIVLKLDYEMASEVVEAVLDSFEENMLLEDEKSARIFATTDVASDEIYRYRKNLSAVDPLKWQGLMLTLGHLLFRRSPNPEQLPLIISRLISGLEFEQRSNVGNSIGVAVRDAACFGIWSLARKYSTTELSAVPSASFSARTVLELSEYTSCGTLQVLATQLILSACLDPSGNIRRGASAALQELIGRHPDTIAEGIAIVQVVDYHAVARRSYSMTEVALQAGHLHPIYKHALVTSLLEWRGARAADPESRRWAGKAVNQFAELLSELEVTELCKNVMKRLALLQKGNTGNTASIRHGYLLALAGALDLYRSIPEGSLTPPKESQSIESTNASLILRIRRFNDKISRSVWHQLTTLIGDLNGRTTQELEYVLEATAVLISSEARLLDSTNVHSEDDSENTFMNLEEFSKMRIILERCITASEKDFVVEAAAKAFSDIFQCLPTTIKSEILNSWLAPETNKRWESRSRGRIECIGRAFKYTALATEMLSYRTRIIQFLTELATGHWPIETRVNAMTGLAIVLRSLASNDHGDLASEDAESIIWRLEDALIQGLTDHSIDQRGDVGSLMRLQSVEAVEALLDIDGGHDLHQTLLRFVTRLALEKLAKVRFQAGLCLLKYWRSNQSFPNLTVTIEHHTEVSSTAYFRQTLTLLEVDWLQEDIIIGFVSSAFAGTEDIGRASRGALMAYLAEQSPEKRLTSCKTILDTLLIDIDSKSCGDDRDLIPALECLAFLLDQEVVPVQVATPVIQDIMPKVHSASSSMSRLEACILVYSALHRLESSKKLALDKLTRLLLHRYPKIRNLAADTLYLHTEARSMLAIEWTVAVAELKPRVISLRKELKMV